MDTMRLSRFAYSKDFTLGFMRWGSEFCYTVEDAWADNQRMISCIPDGDYIVRPRRYYKGGYEAWEITDVPGRDHILIHRGNTADNVTGCIVVGETLGVLGGKIAVEDSRSAFRRLERTYLGRTFTLSIRPEPPLPGTPIRVEGVRA